MSYITLIKPLLENTSVISNDSQDMLFRGCIVILIYKSICKMIENRIRKCSDFGTNVDTLRQFFNALMMQLVGPISNEISTFIYT
jgi:hypothetical protein